MEDKEEENYYSTGKVKHAKITKPEKSYAKPLLAVVVLVIVAIAGFFGGVAYESGHAKPAVIPTASRAGQFSNFSSGQGGYGGYNGQRPTFGSVTAVTSTSITVQDQQSSTKTTFSITSSTTITDNGSTIGVQDIKVGDTVIVRASTKNATQATAIMVNPNSSGDSSTPTGSDDATTD